MTTRELRLWHWKQAMYHRELARSKKRAKKPGSAYGNNRQADFHIRAVQVLNDCADCIATTAEQDAANEQKAQVPSL